MTRYLIYLLIVFSFACANQKTAVVAPLESPIAGAININTASEQELQKIPHIGPKNARDIIEFREKHGRFRRPEQLLLIDGISDTRFRSIRRMIVTE